MDVRHERRGLLVSRQYEPNGAVVKGIHQLEVLLARDAEGEADALVLKAVDQQGRGLHGSQMPPWGLVHSVRSGSGLGDLQDSRMTRTRAFGEASRPTATFSALEDS